MIGNLLIIISKWLCYKNSQELLFVFLFRTMYQMKMILCKKIKHKPDLSQGLSLSSSWQHMNTGPFFWDRDSPVAVKNNFMTVS